MFLMFCVCLYVMSQERLRPARSVAVTTPPGEEQGLDDALGMPRDTRRSQPLVSENDACSTLRRVETRPSLGTITTLL